MEGVVRKTTSGCLKTIIYGSVSVLNRGNYLRCHWEHPQCQNWRAKCVDRCSSNLTFKSRKSIKEKWNLKIRKKKKKRAERTAPRPNKTNHTSPYELAINWKTRIKKKLKRWKVQTALLSRNDQTTKLFFLLWRKKHGSQSNSESTRRKSHTLTASSEIQHSHA